MKKAHVTEVVWYVECPHCNSTVEFDFNPVGCLWFCSLCKKDFEVVD